MSQYKCLDGSPIVRDGEYQTRDGRKAVVLGFMADSIYPIIGYSSGHGPKGRTALGKVFVCEMDSPLDLMRPWQKPIEGWVHADLGESIVQFYNGYSRGPNQVSIKLSYDPATKEAKVIEVVHDEC